MGSTGERRGRGRVGFASKCLLIATAALIALGSVSALAKTKAKPKKPTAAQISKNLSALYAQAKKEGSVNLSVETSTTSYAALIAGFDAKYPGINVSMVDTPDPELASTIISQADTGNLQVDLALGRPEEIGDLVSRNLIAQPNWATLGIANSQILLGDRLVKDSDFVTGVVYNTNLVSKADAPKTWRDLLLPKWSGGKIAVDGESTNGFESELVSQAWTQNEYVGYLKKLHAQKPLVIYSAAPLLSALAQGQAAIGLAPLTIVSALIAKGAPLAVAPIQPLVTSPDSIFVLRHAAHPAAAELLAAYLGSDAAKTEWRTGGWTDATPASQGGEAGILGAGGVTTFVPLNTAKKIAVFDKAEQLNIRYLGFTGS
jgi:iron(III) transport system substrate-binding protein